MDTARSSSDFLKVGQRRYVSILIQRELTMTTSTKSEFKVTYATLSADNKEMHEMLDKSISKAKNDLGKSYPLYIGGQERKTDKTTDTLNPANTNTVLAKVASATSKDVADAVAAAKKAFPSWRKTLWQDRATIIEKAANLVRERKGELTAWLIMENGKNRVEALGEIEETADLYEYYAQQLRLNEGYVKPMGSLSNDDKNTSVLRPYGVWVVIAPWNFPYALLGAPIAAALVTGNTVVAKPSSETPMSAIKLYEIFRDAGVPDGVVNVITGSGRVMSDVIVDNPDVAGITFTGSYDVGMKLYKQFGAKYPKPCIVEMGGKNPAIIMPSADLDRAVQGVYRSAFGMGGQKCSACSRVYVHKDIAKDFLERLAQKASETVIGDPLERETYLGPVGTRGGYDDFQRFSELGKKDGKVLSGAEIVKSGIMSDGYFVRPTLIAGLPENHSLLKEELFLPYVCAVEVSSLDEALAHANDTDFGLTAGFFSQQQSEIDRFLDEIEAGVVYVNRTSGATTGAWPGVQPFGGWKGSGSTGKNIGGLYTLPCYMREQSRTIVS